MKKPKPLGLLASKSEISAAIAIEKEYSDRLIADLLTEYQCSSLENLIVVLAEEFHPKYKIKNRRGTKVKWSSFLKALLSSEISRLQKKNQPRKSAIYELMESKPWAKLLRNSKEPYELIISMDKQGRKLPLYSAINSAYKLALLEDELHKWEEMINSSIDEALEKKKE